MILHTVAGAALSANIDLSFPFNCIQEMNASTKTMRILTQIFNLQKEEKKLLLYFTEHFQL